MANGMFVNSFIDLRKPSDTVLVSLFLWTIWGPLIGNPITERIFVSAFYTSTYLLMAFHNRSAFYKVHFCLSIFSHGPSWNVEVHR